MKIILVIKDEFQYGKIYDKVKFEIEGHATDVKNQIEYLVEKFPTLKKEIQK